MSAEVYSETVYVADCEDCGYESDYFESRIDAERDAERHDETCPHAEEPDHRTDREKYQDELDAIVAGRLA